MEINCYMNFKGNCREAITFYEKIFSTKAKTMTFGELPPDPAFPINDEMKKLIMYGFLTDRFGIGWQVNYTEGI